MVNFFLRSSYIKLIENKNRTTNFLNYSSLIITRKTKKKKKTNHLY